MLTISLQCESLIFHPNAFAIGRWLQFNATCRRHNLRDQANEMVLNYILTTCMHAPLTQEAWETSRMLKLLSKVGMSNSPGPPHQRKEPPLLSLQRRILSSYCRLLLSFVFRTWIKALSNGASRGDLPLRFLSVESAPVQKYLLSSADRERHQYSPWWKEVVNLPFIFYQDEFGINFPWLCFFANTRIYYLSIRPM